MPTTSPAITIPQNSSMKSIMTIPPAPQTHHIGCIPQPQSGTRSWASAAPGARAAPDPTSHHLARRNIVGPPLLTSHHEDATIAYGALDRRVWQHRRLHRTELSLKVVDERERRRTLLGKLNTTPQRPGATRGERYATCAEAYHCEDGSTGGAPGRGDAR